MDIDELIQGNDQLASLPEIYYQLNEAIHDPDCTFDDIGEIISMDAGLTARLLQIVNSAFYGFSSQVETVTHSLTIIGTDQLTQLVLASSVMSRFKGIPEDLLNMEGFWRHSIASGLAARTLATLSGEYNVERYFVAGLLHDVGRLVMAVKIPDQTRAIIEKVKESGQSLYEEEQRTLGFDHAELGGRLLKSWYLPERLEEAVTHHHNPAGAINFPEEAAVVNLANAIAQNMQLGESGEANAPALSPKSWEAIGLPESLYLPMVKDKVEQQYEDVVKVFFQQAHS
jgi:putative nucleotidyltransferase with HDIG domain